MEETLDQKIARITKFGITDAEICKDSDESLLLVLAHSKNLGEKLDKTIDVLEKIATGMISTGEAQALATDVLEQISLRKWR